MADIFGEDDLETVPPDVAAGIPHAATRTFLVEVGLPDQADTQGWFHRVLDLSEEVGDRGPDQWISLGEIPYDCVDVDASTGVVHATPADGGEPYPLNSGLGAFAYLLCVAEAELPFYSGTAEQTLADGTVRAQVEARLERLYGMPREQMGPTPEARLRAAIERVDPLALARPDSTWQMVLRYVTEGMD